MAEAAVQIAGAVEQPLKLTPQSAQDLGEDALVLDVSTIDPRREGHAVRLDALLQAATPSAEATHLTVHSSDGFAASVPLEAVQSRGLLLFGSESEPLPVDRGGPFRFLIVDAAECKTAELDACANVKHVARIELTIGPGRDTR